MKRYIRSNQEPCVHLRDVIDTVDMVVIVEDIYEYRMDHILGAEDIDYSQYTDEELLSITDDEMTEICDLDTLVRILQLAPDRLMEYQCTIIDQADIHVDIDDTDVEFILNKMKHCTEVRWEPRNRNKAFRLIHDLDDDDVLDLIHSITPDELKKKIWGVRGEHRGSQLLVFQPKRPMYDKHGTLVPDFEIYVKIDKTQSVADKSAVIVISLHATRGEVRRQDKRDKEIKNL